VSGSTIGSFKSRVNHVSTGADRRVFNRLSLEEPKVKDCQCIAENSVFGSPRK